MLLYSRTWHVSSDAQTSQWISKYGWIEQLEGFVFITNQEENIKTKNITEKISFDSKLLYVATACMSLFCSIRIYIIGWIKIYVVVVLESTVRKCPLCQKAIRCEDFIMVNVHMKKKTKKLNHNQQFSSTINIIVSTTVENFKLKYTGTHVIVFIIDVRLSFCNTLV